MPAYKKVLNKSDLLEGTGKTVDLEGRQIAVFNVMGNYYAVDNTCIHRGGPLGEGELSDKVVTCPWHGWQFDVTTGASLYNPGSIPVYPVKIDGESVMVEL